MSRYMYIASLVNTHVLPCTFGMFVVSHTCVQCLSVGHFCHLRNEFAVSIKCYKLLGGAALTVVKKSFYPVDRDIIFFRNVGNQLTACAIGTFAALKTSCFKTDYDSSM